MNKSYRAAAKFIGDAFAALSQEANGAHRSEWYDIALSANWERGNLADVASYLDKRQNAFPDDVSTFCEVTAAYLAVKEEIYPSAAIEQVKRDHSVCSEITVAKAPRRLKMLSPIPTRLATKEDADGCMPIVRVSPQYPTAARNRNRTGYVVVQMDAKDDGWVDPKTVKVIEASPKGVFDRAAISAAKKMRYKSEMLHGETRSKTGKTYRFSFNLAN